MTQQAGVPSEQRKLERAIVLRLLSDEHGVRACSELLAGLGDVEPSALAAALTRLQERGVLLVESDTILASPCARRLDALGLIGI